MRKEGSSQEKEDHCWFISDPLTVICSWRNSCQNEWNPENKDTHTVFQRLPFPKGGRDRIVMISTVTKNTCSDFDNSKNIIHIDTQTHTHTPLLSCEFLEGQDCVISSFPKSLVHAVHSFNWISTLVGRSSNLFQVGTQGRVQGTSTS